MKKSKLILLGTVLGSLYYFKKRKGYKESLKKEELLSDLNSLGVKFYSTSIDLQEDYVTVLDISLSIEDNKKITESRNVLLDITLNRLIDYLMNVNIIKTGSLIKISLSDGSYLDYVVGGERFKHIA